MPNTGAASHLHACTHTTFSPNVTRGPGKTNVIPDCIDIEVDIRTLPGEGADEVQAHLNEALGDLADKVEVEILMNDPASISADRHAACGTACSEPSRDRSRLLA